MFNGRIALSPQDIFDKEFKIDTRGYRLQEVDKYLDQIIKDYVEFINIIKELRNENKALEREIDLKHELRDLKANIDIVKKSEKEITNVDILRRLSQLEKYIYDKDEYEKAYKWIKENCKEGFDLNEGKNLPEIIRKSKVVPADKDWEFITKMTMIMRDILYGNKKLDEMGWHEGSRQKCCCRRFPGSEKLDRLASQRRFHRGDYGINL